MLGLLIRVLKRVPRPLFPLLPMLVSMLAGSAMMLLVASSIHVPYRQETDGWGWAPRRNSTVVGSTESQSGPATTAGSRQTARARPSAAIQSHY